VLGRGILAGVVGGAIFAVITMWFTASTGAGAVTPLKMIATILQGDDAFPRDASSILGATLHMVLSVAYGIVFAVVVAAIRASAGVIALLGLLYGAAIFVVNFLVLAPLWFTTFQAANKPFELAIHLVFGAVLTVPLLPFIRRARNSEPPH
jgi:uncharacterized membrane protein YagU involved in acid resistance